MNINWGNNCNDNNFNEKKSKKRKLLVGLENDDQMDRVAQMLQSKNIFVIGTEIHFYSGIDSNSINTIIKIIGQLINNHYVKDNKPNNDPYTITYIVSSEGGCALSVLRFVDFLSRVKSNYPNITFVSVISGFCASAGTVMCAVADKRFMTPNSFAMIHELSTQIGGRYTQLISNSVFVKLLFDKLINIYVNRCNKSYEELQLLLKDDTWYSAEHYLRDGFVDEIK
jgi:ATP-dependent protease ClpP protease subunit